MTGVQRKVLHVIPALAPRYGGPSTAIVGFCRALENAGVQAIVATTDADGRGHLAVPVGEPTLYAGVTVIFFRRRLGEAFKWSSGMSAWLRSHVSAFDLVEVHAVFSHASLAAGRACRLASVPYVVRPLGTLDPWSLARKRMRKQWLMRFGAHDLLTGAAAIHYTSQDEMRLAEEEDAEREQCAGHLGVDQQTRRPGIVRAAEHGPGEARDDVHVGHGQHDVKSSRLAGGRGQPGAPRPRVEYRQHPVRHEEEGDAHECERRAENPAHHPTQLLPCGRHAGLARYPPWRR